MLCTGDRQADAGARQVFTRNSDTQMILGYVTAGERNQEPSPLELAVSVHKFQDPVELPPPGWNMVELGEVRVTTCLGHDSRNQKCHVCKNGSSVGKAGLNRSKLPQKDLTLVIHVHGVHVTCSMLFGPTHVQKVSETKPRRNIKKINRR